MHHGRGELQTVTGVELIHSHRTAREDPYRLGIGLVGAEAMLRLFTETEGNARAFTALTRFLDVLDELPPRPHDRPALDPLALSFQLKLLWLAGYLPHLATCANCGAAPPLVAYAPRAGGAVCEACAAPEAIPLSPEGYAAVDGLLRRPLAEAAAAVRGERAARETLRVIGASYEEHGGFRLRTLSA